MATASPNIKSQARIPFWRDVRVLGIIGQVIFTALVIMGSAWLIGNFRENAEVQGIRVGFDFLNSTAAFDIAEGIEYEATDTFGRALWVGMVNTIRISIIGIILTTLLGIITGIARLSNNWLVNKIATVYVETVRNIPLLVLLFFIYFAVILKLPPVKESIQPLGLPIYLSQRGIVLPGLTPTVGFRVWLSFVLLAVILVILLWIIQNWREKHSGQPNNKLGPAVVMFLVVVIVGWFVTSRLISNQAIIVPTVSNISSFADFEKIYLLKIDPDALTELGADKATISTLTSAKSVAIYKDQLNAKIESKTLTETEAETAQAQITVIDDAAIVVCSVADTLSEINAASQLRRHNIPVKVESEKTMGKAGAAYAAGSCDLLAGDEAALAAEQVILDVPDGHVLLPVQLPPLAVNTPALAGFNIQGGTKLTPEYAALLIGLVLYTGAFAAEIVRAGILAVSKGQSEAARALGLREGQRLRLIVLPQALRVIIPPMTSQYLNLTKNSSLAIAIGYPDLVAVGNTVLNQSGFAVQVILIFMASYLVLSLSISAFLNWYNRKVALVER